MVDVDATGAVCGIELLNAREQLEAGEGETLGGRGARTSGW